MRLDIPINNKRNSTISTLSTCDKIDVNSEPQVDKVDVVEFRYYVEWYTLLMIDIIHWNDLEKISKLFSSILTIIFPLYDTLANVNPLSSVENEWILSGVSLGLKMTNPRHMLDVNAYLLFSVSIARNIAATIDRFIRYTLFLTKKITLLFLIKYSNLIATCYSFRQFHNRKMILYNPRPKKRELFIFSRNETPLKIHLFSTERHIDRTHSYTSQNGRENSRSYSRRAQKERETKIRVYETYYRWHGL